MRDPDVRERRNQAHIRVGQLAPRRLIVYEPHDLPRAAVYPPIIPQASARPLSTWTSTISAPPITPPWRSRSDGPSRSVRRRSSDRYPPVGFHRSGGEHPTRRLSLLPPPISQYPPMCYDKWYLEGKAEREQGHDRPDSRPAKVGLG